MDTTHRLVLYPDPPPKRKKGGLKGGLGLRHRHGQLGHKNQWTSNMLDHVVNNQHKAAMPHLCTAQERVSNEPITSYAPIVHSLLKEEE